MAELSSSELLQKLALSRAAQQTAGFPGSATPSRSRRGSAYANNSSAASVGGASEAFSEDFVVPRSRLSGMMSVTPRPSYLKQVQGFNSFMGDAVDGWRVELLSSRLRQAVLAEFVAMSA